MASRLTGLQRTLTWQDFGTPRNDPPPPPGQRGTAAQTRVRPSRSIFAEHIPGTRPPQFRLRDDAAVSVVLDDANTFVNQWALSRPAPFPTDLLHHEQGHYDLCALFIRDMFIELMALKQLTASNPQAVMTAAQAIFTRYDGFIAAVHDPYDTDTSHGNTAPQQQRWDGFISTAFTSPRTPPMSAPDGTLYKVQLADVLRAGGVTL